MIQIGQPFECAAWFDPANPDAHDKTKQSLLIAMTRLQEGAHVVFGEFCWTILEPGDDRVPDPPETAPNGIQLMLVDAEVVEMRGALADASFITDLDYIDLEILRRLTRKCAAMHGQTLTDDECDVMIEQIGPKMAEQVLCQAILN